MEGKVPTLVEKDMKLEAFTLIIDSPVYFDESKYVEELQKLRKKMQTNRKITICFLREKNSFKQYKENPLLGEAIAHACNDNIAMLQTMLTMLKIKAKKVEIPPCPRYTFSLTKNVHSSMQI